MYDFWNIHFSPDDSILYHACYVAYNFHYENLLWTCKIKQTVWNIYDSKICRQKFSWYARLPGAHGRTVQAVVVDKIGLTRLETEAWDRWVGVSRLTRVYPLTHPPARPHERRRMVLVTLGWPPTAITYRRRTLCWVRRKVVDSSDVTLAHQTVRAEPSTGNYVRAVFNGRRHCKGFMWRLFYPRIQTLSQLIRFWGKSLRDKNRRNSRLCSSWITT